MGLHGRVFLEEKSPGCESQKEPDAAPLISQMRELRPKEAKQHARSCRVLRAEHGLEASIPTPRWRMLAQASRSGSPQEAPSEAAGLAAAASSPPLQSQAEWGFSEAQCRLAVPSPLVWAPRPCCPCHPGPDCRDRLVRWLQWIHCHLFSSHYMNLTIHIGCILNLKILLII